MVWYVIFNRFTDMTMEERRQYLGHDSSMSQTLRGNYQEASIADGTLPNVRVEDLPASVDWYYCISLFADSRFSFITHDTE
jgi:hypothetical protein